MSSDRNVDDLESAIRDYWEDASTASIIDKNLQTLEIETVCRHLQANDRLADIGCGDGAATAHYARRVASVVAVERSERLRGLAARRFADENLSNVSLCAGDVIAFGAGGETFDAVVTQRVLINLIDWDTQKKSLDAITMLVRPGGRYIMVENTTDAFDSLNAMRAKMDLGPIPLHWHNRFFDYAPLMAHMETGFRLEKEYNFGLYYLLTRIYVPMFASFTGWGATAKKDPIFEVADAAAKRVFDAFADQVTIAGCRALGPIQCFVFRRRD